MSPPPFSSGLVTTAFTLLLLALVFLIGLRLKGLMVATVMTAFLIASPGFLTLGSSFMLEIPALGPAVAAVCVLLWGGKQRWMVILAGALFGFSLEIKLVTVILLPLVALVLWWEHPHIKGWLLFGFGLVFSFIALDVLIERGAFLLHCSKPLVSHFAPAKSFDTAQPMTIPSIGSSCSGTGTRCPRLQVSSSFHGNAANRRRPSSLRYGSASCWSFSPSTGHGGRITTFTLPFPLLVCRHWHRSSVSTLQFAERQSPFRSGWSLRPLRGPAGWVRGSIYKS